MLRAIIIDDEKIGINTLKMLLEKHTPEIKVVAIASEPEKGLDLIEDYKPEVVFLDVNMPRLDGFSLLQQLNYKNFKLVFTTAYEEYALKAIKHKAFDYLVKPIDIDELKICIDNILVSLDQKPDRSKTGYENIIEIPIKNGIIFIKPRDIIRLEADGSYTIFYMVNKIKHLASKNLKEFEALLDPRVFFRTHPSHLVNLTMVERIDTNEGLFILMSDDSTAQLLKRNKQAFLEKLKNI